MRILPLVNSSERLGGLALGQAVKEETIMHHLIERSVQKYRLTTGLLRCLAPSDPCGLRTEKQTIKFQSSEPRAEAMKTDDAQRASLGIS